MVLVGRSGRKEAVAGGGGPVLGTRGCRRGRLQAKATGHTDPRSVRQGGCIGRRMGKKVQDPAGGG